MALAAAGVVLLGLLGVLFKVRARSQKPSNSIKGMDALLEAGRYHEAASLAMQHKRWADALDLFLRAQEPGRAAGAAQRMGNVRLAAELYERAGEPDRAAQLYDEAGHKEKARQLRNVAPKAPPVNDVRAAQKARDLAKKASSLEERVQAQEAAQKAAEVLLSQGEITRAAELYRDAELYDDAINLYATVLGQPAEAAALMLKKGQPERAAELFEVAGEPESAARVWADVARNSAKPLDYLDRIEKLSPKTLVGLLEKLTGSDGPSKDNAELHYRLGLTLAKEGQAQRARELFEALRGAVGAYKDLDARLSALERRENPSLHDPRREDATRVDPHPPTIMDRAPRVVVQPVLLEASVPTEEARAMVQQATRAAVERARRSSFPPPMGASRDGPTVSYRVTHEHRVFAQGLEPQKLTLDLMQDAAVRAARGGPGVETLRAYVGDRPCDLQNIEVFYRLGLAHLAAGAWSEALAAFLAVEDASPGYRDAEGRAAQLRAWQLAVGSKASVLGARVPQAPADAGRYQLRGELGRGGMAVVYRAVDTLLGREVALKFLAPEFSEHKEMKDLFAREARSVAGLNHPNIVTVYDIGEYGGRSFIAMEFVEGQTVAELITEQERVPVLAALQITQQVLQALDAAHGRQIIHRDVKPSNMMRLPSGLVKLMDFGLAKSIAGGAKASVVAGTPAYMPEEQLLGNDVDHRADLFSAGVSLYEMLAGDVPFTGLDRSSTPLGLRGRVPGVPEVLDKVLATALAKDPSARFQTAQDFAIPVRRILAAVSQMMRSPAKK